MSQDPHCRTGEKFFVCFTSNFRGCCAQDPCIHHRCPRASPPGGDDGGISDPRDGDDDNEKKPFPESDKETTTMTDSGVTHTIPNDEVVTVTRHTMIITGVPKTTLSTVTTAESSYEDDLPTSRPLESSSEASSVRLPTPTASNDSSTAGSPLPMGAIIGIAVGGAVLALVLLAAIFFVRRHSRASRQQRLDSERRDSSARDELVEGKHFPQAMSAHTTGSQGYNDPFAPFGGRADEPEDIYRPRDNTFEMDGTSAAPVELPAISVEPPSPAQEAAVPVQSQKSSQRPKSDHMAKTVDPRANLNKLGQQGDQPAYINHWNQYKDVAGT